MENIDKKARNILFYQFIAMVIFNMAHPVTPTHRLCVRLLLLTITFLIGII